MERTVLFKNDISIILSFCGQFDLSVWGSTDPFESGSNRIRTRNINKIEKNSSVQLQESLGSWLKLATSSPRHASLLAGKSSGTPSPAVSFFE
jgi:hypothetical protein